MRPPGSGSGNGATVLEFGPMFEKVRRSRFKLKVGDAVVKRVPVLVVYDHPRRDRAIGFLPHHDRSRLPDVRLRDLDPSAPIPAALVAGTNANGSHIASAVAHILGRHGIGVDLSADYLRLAEWRCNDPGLRAKVLRVDKPKAVPDGQLDMFGDAA